MIDITTRIETEANLFKTSYRRNKDIDLLFNRFGELSDSIRTLYRHNLITYGEFEDLYTMIVSIRNEALGI